jgi:hypothetical protein
MQLPQPQPQEKKGAHHPPAGEELTGSPKKAVSTSLRPPPAPWQRHGFQRDAVGVVAAAYKWTPARILGGGGLGGSGMPRRDVGGGGACQEEHQASGHATKREGCRWCKSSCDVSRQAQYGSWRTHMSSQDTKPAKAGIRGGAKRGSPGIRRWGRHRLEAVDPSCRWITVRIIATQNIGEFHQGFARTSSSMTMSSCMQLAQCGATTPIELLEFKFGMGGGHLRRDQLLHLLAYQGSCRSALRRSRSAGICVSTALHWHLCGIGNPLPAAKTPLEAAAGTAAVS